MQTWLNTHLTITTKTTTTGLSNQQVLPDCRELTAADISTIIAIFTPLLTHPISMITTQATNEFVN
ncbi:hypothetical protein [Lactiplantibacillus herbarum]|uniref:hypothetical protein n=1 Tax=Lactiplantibacillus herbarum TaxID=1670446 RepID=UPI00064FC72C|nr:hypothetical protein [Lactiplantibacillus herbarum]